MESQILTWTETKTAEAALSSRRVGQFFFLSHHFAFFRPKEKKKRRKKEPIQLPSQLKSGGTNENAFVCSRLDAR